MIKSFTSFLVLLFFTIGIHAQEINKTHKDSLNSVINAYYELNIKVFQADSKVEDIDSIFNLFTPDFTYVHPKYGGTYTREDLYKGYIRNQKNGMYNGTVFDIIITNKIVGLNAAAVERVYVEKENGKEIEDAPKMTLFEFKEGKISRIHEYW